MLEVIFSRYRVPFKGYLGIKKLPKSMQQIITKMDAIWDALFFKGRGPTAEARAMELHFLAIIRRQSSEHAHAPQVGSGFKGSAPAVGPFALWRLERCKSALP